MSYKKVFTIESIPKHIKQIHYDETGPIMKKASSYQNDLDEGKKLPFKQLSQLQEGNPQVIGMHPITFMRQVMACVFDKSLWEQKWYHQDVINRAKQYFNLFPSIGVYPDTQGFLFNLFCFSSQNRDLRENIAKFITKRDGGVPCNSNFIFNTAGGMHAISTMVEFLIKDKFKDGIMISVPSHPLLAASIDCFGGKPVEYYLDEANNWEINIKGKFFQNYQCISKELQAKHDQATKEGINVKGIIIVNPCNPTGQILSEEKIKEIIHFCHKNSLVIIANEIYQQNIYDKNQKFTSFKKVVMEMGVPISEDVQLISINSISKGYYGEGGLRGGYMELINIEQGIFDNLWKLDGMYSTPNNSGQIALELMVNPPSKENNCSQETIDCYNKEIQEIHNSLVKKASIVTDYLRQCKNITSSSLNGAFYVFPQIKLSENAKKAAEKAGLEPDTFFCFECLDETGIVLQPGKEFGQIPGTYHFRISILNSTSEQIEEQMKSFKKFNDSFHEKYA